MNKIIGTFIILAVFSLICPTLGQADFVYIKNGDKIFGTIQNPTFSVQTPYGKVSIKNAQPSFGGVNAEPSDLSPEVKTAATGKSEAKVKPDPVVKEEPAKEVKMQEEKSAQEVTEKQVAKSKAQAQSKEPIGYKEVELPNGDIEMVPIFEDDWEDDE